MTTDSENAKCYGKKSVRVMRLLPQCSCLRSSGVSRGVDCCSVTNDQPMPRNIPEERRPARVNLSIKNSVQIQSNLNKLARNFYFIPTIITLFSKGTKGQPIVERTKPGLLSAIQRHAVGIVLGSFPASKVTFWVAVIYSFKDDSRKSCG